MFPLVAKLRTLGRVTTGVAVEELVASVEDEMSEGIVVLDLGLQALPATRSTAARAANARMERIVNE
jgi:hypothetical protein